MTTKIGLDMAPTLYFYQLGSLGLPAPVTSPLPFDVDGQSHMAIHEQQIAALWELYPAAARRRSNLAALRGQPPLFFHRDSDVATKNLIPTNDVDEAISPTAIIPSYIDNTQWPKSVITLYQLPDTIDQRVKELVHAEGFLHELAHSIINPALYGDQQWQLPDGTVIDGGEFIVERFGEQSESLAPISHYSAFYRTEADGYPEVRKDRLIAISEELCESCAAYLLGFTSCGDPALNLDPFADRPHIEQLVSEFLNAEAL